VDRNTLRDILIQHFDAEEIRDLCFQLGIEADNLRGENKPAVIRELVGYADRRGELWKLIGMIFYNRPNLFWSNAYRSQAVADSTAVPSWFKGRDDQAKENDYCYEFLRDILVKVDRRLFRLVAVASVALMIGVFNTLALVLLVVTK